MNKFLLTTLLFCFNQYYGQSEPAKLKISQLIGDFYIYTTYNSYEVSQLQANGMYIVTKQGVVLFDTLGYYPISTPTR